jgi:hypothetical protein
MEFDTYFPHFLCVLTISAHLIFLNLITLISGNGTNYESPRYVIFSILLFSLFNFAPTLELRASVKLFVSLQFLNPKTVGRTPWTGDQPIARPLPTHRINAHRHPCLE